MERMRGEACDMALVDRTVADTTASATALRCRIAALELHSRTHQPQTAIIIQRIMAQPKRALFSPAQPRLAETRLPQRLRRKQAKKIRQPQNGNPFKLLQTNKMTVSADYHLGLGSERALENTIVGEIFQHRYFL
jgi:hypothetical protein